MNKELCEKVRISAMAIADGQKSQLSESQINEHLLICKDCKAELEQIKSISNLFESQARRIHEVDISSQIEEVLSNQVVSPYNSGYLRYFVFLGFILFVLKMIELSPIILAGIIIKFISIPIIITFFVLIRQNPFVINQKFEMKGEI